MDGACPLTVSVDESGKLGAVCCRPIAVGVFEVRRRRRKSPLHLKPTSPSIFEAQS